MNYQKDKIQLYKGKYFYKLTKENHIEGRLTKELFDEIVKNDDSTLKLNYNKLENIHYSKDIPNTVFVIAINKTNKTNYFWMNYDDFKNAHQ